MLRRAVSVMTSTVRAPVTTTAVAAPLVSSSMIRRAALMPTTAIVTPRVPLRSMAGGHSSKPRET
jgi:hypothetical protein